MKNFCLSSWLLIGINFLVTNAAHPQQLATRWSVNVNGNTHIAKHMAVVPETGHRYYLIHQFDHGFSLVHLDQNGEEVWNLEDHSFFRPHSLIYDGGKIFLFGTNARSDGLPGAAAVWMYEDLGTAPRRVWEYGLSTKGRVINGEIVIADPAGDGVIFVSRSSTFTPTDTEILKTTRISATREVVNYDDISIGAYAPGANPNVHGMCADDAGNVYVTGLSDPVSRSTAEGYVNPCTQFIVKFNRSGRLAWTAPVTEVGYHRFGFDIDVDGSSVYVLGQRVREHSDATTPVTTGETILTKINPVTGAIIRSVSLSSRLRNTSVRSTRRNSLLVNRTTGNLFIAYDASDRTNVTVKAFNTSLDEQWMHNIPLLSGAHFASIISPSAGRLAVAVNDHPTQARRMVITSFTFANEQFDRYESTIGGVMDMQADASGRIHIGGLLPEPVVPYVQTFEQVLHYRSNYRISPTGVYATPYVLMDLLRSPGNPVYWGSARVNWDCSTLPCNPSFMASMSGDGASWKETIAKPTTINLPQDKFNTFRLSIEKNSAYNTVFEVDRTLTDNGIKSLRLEVDNNFETLTVTTSADASDIPLTFSLIGSSGKLIKELKTVAPGKEVFSDRVPEPVSYIRISAPPVAPNVSLYPNPSNGKFSVALDNPVTYPVQLTIHNGQGTMVHQQLLYAADTPIQLNNPMPGLYIAKVAVGKLIITKTLQVKY